MDVADWDRVSKQRWSLKVKGRLEEAKTNLKGKVGMLLTRFVMSPKDGEFVTPRDGNRLNCTRLNLDVQRYYESKGRRTTMSREEGLAYHQRCMAVYSSRNPREKQCDTVAVTA